jgi:RimJ/RimL family protein N-acetyltransferase
VSAPAHGEPVLALERCTLRPWRAEDAQSLALHANDREVWRNMRDAFPHPYTLADAHRWLAMARDMQPTTFLAIEVDGAAVGGIGISPQTDVNRRSGEIGYWLGRSFWNRGITTEAVRAITEDAFTRLDLVRVFTGIFAWNAASQRVLEKCGYEREGVQRRAAFKDGSLVDCVLYARLRPKG